MTSSSHAVVPCVAALPGVQPFEAGNCRTSKAKRRKLRDRRVAVRHSQGHSAELQAFVVDSFQLFPPALSGPYVGAQANNCDHRNFEDLATRLRSVVPLLQNVICSLGRLSTNTRTDFGDPFATCREPDFVSTLPSWNIDAACFYPAGNIIQVDSRFPATASDMSDAARVASDAAPDTCMMKDKGSVGADASERYGALSEDTGAFQKEQVVQNLVETTFEVPEIPVIEKRIEKVAAHTQVELERVRVDFQKCSAVVGSLPEVIDVVGSADTETAGVRLRATGTDASNASSSQASLEDELASRHGDLKAVFQDLRAQYSQFKELLSESGTTFNELSRHEQSKQRFIDMLSEKVISSFATQRPGADLEALVPKFAQRALEFYCMCECAPPKEEKIDVVALSQAEARKPVGRLVRNPGFGSGPRHTPKRHKK